LKCIWIGLHSSSIIHVWSLSDTLHSSRVESIGTSIIHIWSLSDTLHSSRVESIGTSIIHVWSLSDTLHSSRVESIGTSIIHVWSLCINTAYTAYHYNQQITEHAWHQNKQVQTMQQCSDQFIMTAWRPLSETHGWSRYNTFYSWGVLEWSDVGYWCSNTLHSRWVKSIRVIRRGLLMFQYSPLEMSEEYQRVHYKLIWTLLHCLYLFILMSSMFSNLLIIMIGSISSVYEYCLSAGYGQFHTFIPSVLLIFYISGANTSFTGNTILHNTDSNLCLNYFIELLIYIMRFSHCVCS
jgi:hypothetical protein